MKKINYYTALILSGLILYGCEKPAPTELIQDSGPSGDPVQISIVTKDTSDISFSNGFDTTGIASNLTSFQNIINVSGIKVTKNSRTRKISLAQSIFFDKSKAVHTPRGRLIGYHTKTPGKVMFNSVKANLVPYKLKFNYMGKTVDTALGFKYELVGYGNNNSHQFEFHYGSAVNFKFYPKMGPKTNFEIPTPAEITGNIILKGSVKNNNLHVLLVWNRVNDKDIVIIIGVVTKNRKYIFPLFKLKTRDDGEFKIPPDLLNRLQLKKFSQLVFTLIRRYDIHRSFGRDNLFVLSQSIHSIFVDIH